MKVIFHIDFNSFFATVEQQANPRLRGVKTGMRIPKALKLCPDLILVKGDSDKYLSVAKKFINILKGYTDKMEIFSIDEVFLEIPKSEIRNPKYETNSNTQNLNDQNSFEFKNLNFDIVSSFDIRASNFLFNLASDIKKKIKKQAGEWITVSIGISYNKMLAKLAGSLYEQSLRTNLSPELERFILKPDGVVGIFDPESAMWILDRVELDDICGIGPRIKNRLNNMGIFNFPDLRKVPLEFLLAFFKSYGKVLYNFARGIDERGIVPFFEKEEVKSIGHRHTISHDVSDPEEIKQILLKLCELVARRARAKKLVGKTVSFWFRYAFFHLASHLKGGNEGGNVNLEFSGAGMQTTIPFTSDGLEIFNSCWNSFMKLWDPLASSVQAAVRMVGVSLSNLKSMTPQNLTFLEDINRREVITRALDKINDRYGEFTLQRGILLNSRNIRRMANSFMSDRRFQIG